MDIIPIQVGYLATNCYLLVKDNNCLVVDPGDDSNKIIDCIKKNNLNIKGILLTHFHHDHTGALEDLLTFCKTDVYSNDNLKEGTMTIGEFVFEVIYTPGHTAKCITYYFKKEQFMLTGDFLFKETIGRYDLEDSSFIQMKESIIKIKTYPSDITIYPGHGPHSTLGHEKEKNMYLKTY